MALRQQKNEKRSCTPWAALAKIQIKKMIHNAKKKKNPENFVTVPKKDHKFFLHFFVWIKQKKKLLGIAMQWEAF